MQLVGEAAGGAPQLRHGFAERACHFGQTLRPEHDQGDDENDQEFRSTDTEHG